MIKSKKLEEINLDRKEVKIEEVIIEDKPEQQIIGYVRVSTDNQDLFKQREILEGHAKRLKLNITKFVKVDVSSRKSIEDRELQFLNTLKKDDILIFTETR